MGDAYIAVALFREDVMATPVNPEIVSLRAHVKAATEEFDLAVVCHEVWKPTAYDKAQRPHHPDCRPDHNPELSATDAQIPAGGHASKVAS